MSYPPPGYGNPYAPPSAPPPPGYPYGAPGPADHCHHHHHQQPAGYQGYFNDGYPPPPPPPQPYPPTQVYHYEHEYHHHGHHEDGCFSFLKGWVRVDILNSLKMKDPYIAIGSFDRKNLFYGVKSLNRSIGFLDEVVQEVSKCVAAGSTIIYCTTVKDVEQIHQSLKAAGIKAGIYHGQMSSKNREESHRLFIRDELNVMVATVAFGMGIDKPDIRHVIHYGCPKSLESYYQESGRCGRDGMASVCWLYYSRSDFAKADFYCGDIQGENQRKAVVDSLMAAQRYCLLSTCRRKFLLEHFGEKFPADTCGNCDNCTTERKERDMSKEAYLLMACIQSCRGNWGLNMPIDVLRGSRAKKIVEAHFDTLPLHGHGKHHSANWWKALASHLISRGYLMETMSDIYRIVSVSPKGVEYLKSAGHDHQPPLFLPLVDELDEDNGSRQGEGEGPNSLINSKCEGLSEAEVRLYNMLLEERMKLARAAGIAPYAVCGDDTVKKITLLRPSTKARLANIDGVNQAVGKWPVNPDDSDRKVTERKKNAMVEKKLFWWNFTLVDPWYRECHFLTTYGDHFLQTIRNLAQELSVGLDAEVNIQTVVPRKVTSTSTMPKKLTPAKFEAWRMWYEDGLSIQKIATNPGRSAAIKEQTVLSYLLEAIQEGLPTDWSRLCEEVELTPDLFTSIQAAVTKVGSADKLKPIKDELPENVSYVHIKIFLAMLSSGITSLSQLKQSKEDELQEASEVSPHPSTRVDESCNSDQTNGEHGKHARNELEENDEAISPKRPKVDKQDSDGTAMIEATQSSIVNFLEGHDNGVSVEDILRHFRGSSEESVCSLLGELEADFVIFRKNDLYRIL